MNPVILNQLKVAHARSVPLLAINSPDPAATIRAVNDTFSKVPILAWNIVDGVLPINELGKELRAKIITGDFDPTAGNPVEMCKAASRMGPNAIMFVWFAHLWMVDGMVRQAIVNLRDEFKSNGRMLILLTMDTELPRELAGDVIVLDEPLPAAEQLGTIVKEMCESAELAAPSADMLARSVEAVQGLPAFQAEQVVAMSMSKTGIDIDALWERKRRQIEQTPGLKVQREAVGYKDIGGVDVVKKYLRRILKGKTRPNAVVFVDEIEKMIGGNGGDTSGVSQDQLGQLLTYMQDHSAAGCIFVGPPGAAKSAIAKATGNEAGVPTIQLDLGGAKGSLVGQSEQNLRAALKVITAVSNGRTLWLATCNSIGVLPPELRRRFTLGTFFFDLPDATEREVIWSLYLKKYGLKKAAVKDEGWTGAEIRQCCDIAWRCECSLTEAAEFVVPVSRSASEQLEQLRRAAEGRFLSASKPGVYSQTKQIAEPVANGRRMNLQD